MRNGIAALLGRHPAVRRAWRIVRMMPLVLVTASSPLLTACKDSSGPGGGCCKICRTGKPCGDTCISRTETCHVGAGCACQG